MKTILSCIALLCLFPLRAISMIAQQDSTGLQARVLQTERGNWYYKTGTTGEKALLFLHGANSSHKIWHNQFDLSVPNYKNIFVDLIGYGNSDKPTAGYHLNNWIAGLNQILEQEKLSQVCIVAHSNGVIFAKEFYRAHPDKVTQLILLDGMLQSIIQDQVLDWMRSTLERSDYKEFMAQNVRNMPVQGLEESDQEILHEDALNTPQFIAKAEFALISDPRTWLACTIHCSTTIVHANSPFWDEGYLEALRTIAPQHQLLKWEDAGHFIPMQHAERLNRLIIELLTPPR